MSLNKTKLVELIDALESGLGYARECLHRHHEEMGVGRPLGKRLADSMGQDIEKMQAARDGIWMRVHGRRVK